MQASHERKAKKLPRTNTCPSLATLSEAELLSVIMAEYWQAHPAESPVKAFASMLRCSEQHLYNCLPGGRGGHIGMEDWIEIELHTGTKFVALWWGLKRTSYGMNNAPKR